MTVTDVELEPGMRRATDAPIAMSIEMSFDAVHISREEWDRVVLDTDGDIFSSYDWCRIWWKHYGSGRLLRVLVFRQQGRLVGLAPMFIERIGIGPLAVRIAKPISADFIVDVFALPVPARSSQEIYRQIVSYFVATERCDVIWFGFTPAEHHSLASLRGIASETGGVASCARDKEAGVQTLFDLCENYESYLETLGRASRQSYRRKLSLLRKAHKVEQAAAPQTADALAELAAFRALHTEQWEAEGLPGHFNDWPNSDAFNRDLVTELSDLGRLRMMHLGADGRTIASQYTFTFGMNCYWRLPARAVEEELTRFGLGVLSLMQMIEQMHREGMRRIEGGYGRYPYKLQYGGRERAVISLLLKSNRPAAFIRAHAFVALSKLTHLLYYRLWRLRIAPKLAIQRGPLWQFWIRLRI